MKITNNNLYLAHKGIFMSKKKTPQEAFEIVKQRILSDISKNLQNLEKSSQNLSKSAPASLSSGTPALTEVRGREGLPKMSVFEILGNAGDPLSKEESLDKVSPNVSRGLKTGTKRSIKELAAARAKNAPKPEESETIKDPTKEVAIVRAPASALASGADPMPKKGKGKKTKALAVKPQVSISKPSAKSKAKAKAPQKEEAPAVGAKDPAWASGGIGASKGKDPQFASKEKYKPEFASSRTKGIPSKRSEGHGDYHVRSLGDGRVELLYAKKHKNPVLNLIFGSKPKSLGTFGSRAEAYDNWLAHSDRMKAGFKKAEESAGESSESESASESVTKDPSTVSDMYPTLEGAKLPPEKAEDIEEVSAVGSGGKVKETNEFLKKAEGAPASQGQTGVVAAPAPITGLEDTRISAKPPKGEDTRISRPKGISSTGSVGRLPPPKITAAKATPVSGVAGTEKGYDTEEGGTYVSPSNKPPSIAPVKPIPLTNVAPPNVSITKAEEATGAQAQLNWSDRHNATGSHGSYQLANFGNRTEVHYQPHGGNSTKLVSFTDNPKRGSHAAAKQFVETHHDLHETGKRLDTHLASKKADLASKKMAKAEERCWDGYEPVPGKKPYEKGSCAPVKKEEESGSSEESESDEDVACTCGADDDLEKADKPFKGYNPKKHAKTGGLNDKYREKYNRETGSNLKRPTKDKKNSRHKSFCARMKGVKGPTSKEGKLTPKGAALKRWGCSKTELEKQDLTPAQQGALQRDEPARNAQMPTHLQKNPFKKSELMKEMEQLDKAWGKVEKMCKACKSETCKCEMAKGEESVTPHDWRPKGAGGKLVYPKKGSSQAKRGKTPKKADERGVKAHFESDKHKSGGCGPVCTFGDW